MIGNIYKIQALVKITASYLDALSRLLLIGAVATASDDAAAAVLLLMFVLLQLLSILLLVLEELVFSGRLSIATGVCFDITSVAPSEWQDGCAIALEDLPPMQFLSLKVALVLLRFLEFDWFDCSTLLLARAFGKIFIV